MNNTGILSKCIEELNKETFRKDYVLGMLETLVEMNEPMGNRLAVGTPDFGSGNGGSNPSSPAEDDEAAILDGRARAAIAAVQDLAAQSNHE